MQTPSRRRAALLLTAFALLACGGGPDAAEQAARFEVFPMLEKYRGEEHGGGHYGTVVRYLTPEEQKAHLVRVRDGLLIDAQGAPLDPDLDRHPERSGFAMYVMDPHGTLYYSFDHKQGAFHHSSLLAGAPVAGAGDMTILEGRLLEVSNSSGHYRPPPRTLDAVMARLAELGVDTAAVKVTRVGDER